MIEAYLGTGRPRGVSETDILTLEGVDTYYGSIRR